MRNALLLSLTLTTVHSLKPSQYGSGSPNMNPPTSRAYNINNNNNNNDNYNNNNSNNNNNDNNYNDNSNQNPGGDVGYVPTTSYQEDNSFDQESVEERLASWREQQQERYEGQNPVDELNPRDEEGRLKLLATVSRGSISVFFFVLMWRSVHHFELADQSFRKSSKRLFLVVPTMVLFIGNMAGCVASISSRTLKAKKRMKAILNLNKLVELLLFVYNIIRLAFFANNKLVPREVYVGRTLTNFMFIVQCQLFTRVTWDAAQANQGTTIGQPRDRGTDTQAEYSRNGYDYDDADGDMTYSQRQPTPYADPNDDWEGRR